MKVNNITRNDIVCVCRTSVIDYINSDAHWCYVNELFLGSFSITSGHYTKKPDYVLIIIATITEEDKILITLKNDYIAHRVCYDNSMSTVLYKPCYKLP